MSKFLSKDRKRILLSITCGTILLGSASWMISSDYGILQIIGILIILFTYCIFQFAIFYDRNLIDCNDKVLNADGRDITKKLPYNIAFQFTGFFIIVIFLNNLTTDLMLSFKMDINNNIELMQFLHDFLVIIEPYLIIHLYFFIKNLPITVLRIYMIGTTSSKNNFSEYKMDYSSSSKDYYYNSNNSSYGGNIFHKSDRN